MNAIIEQFGVLVGKMAASRPASARRLLALAFHASNLQAQHLPSRHVQKAPA